MRNAVEHLTPFCLAIASIQLADLNAAAALTLSLLGIFYTSRKIWLSFQTKKTGKKAH